MFSAGFNQPGYLPESDPGEFDTFDEAKRYIIDEILRAAEDTENDDDAETLDSAAQDINLESRDFSSSIMPDGYVYWVMES